jgi:tetratricopeptide (TPR) repeat protein
MAKKRREKRREARNDAAPRSSESIMTDLQKLIEEQGLESIDEINAFMQELVTEGKPIPRMKKETPLEQAQDLIYDAWESASQKKRISLANKALELSPDCADAYSLLAVDTASSAQEAKELYEKAVEAGKRAIGEAAFEEAIGHFWGVFETRPYMRARAGLADCLWQLGEKEATAEHYREMLRLNPNDNQGIRYLLIDTLLELDDDAAVGKLLKQYKDDASPNWTYSWALYQFRKDGASNAAKKRLQEALSWNAHVPAYLLGKKRIPKHLPPYVTFMGEDEAQHYAAGAKPLWEKTAGALDWLNGFSLDSDSSKT